MRVTRVRSAVVAIAIAVVALVALRASAVATQSDATARAMAEGQRLGASAFFAHGKLQDPVTIASHVSNLNATLDACYTSHGATRINMTGGAWAYQDPRGAAQAACQSQQDAVNAYSHSAEMTGYIRPLLHAFWSCMSSRGIIPANADDIQVDTQSAAFKAGTETCSAAANRTVGVSGP